MIESRSETGSQNCQQKLPRSSSHQPGHPSPAKFCFALFFALLPFLDATSASTVAEKNPFTQAEIDLITKTLLKQFNMKELPTQMRPALPVPYYVWNLYEKIQSEDVDSIRHYYPQRMMETTDRKLLLRYNLTVTTQNITDERVIGAVLKLKLNKGNRQRRVKVHEIDQRNPDILRLIDSRQVEPEPRKDHKWVDMDVSEALTRRRPEMQRVDFAVEIMDGELASTISPAVSTLSAIPYSKTQEAALVVYIQSYENSKSRKKRRAGERRKRQHRLRSHKKEAKYCRRRELTIDFKQLGWNDWIIAPLSYKAYQCQGECPYPLPNSMNTTNHAIVQGILNSIDPERIPPPCCVPTEMESLAILYTDIEGKIVVKKYPDMEIKTCGCR